MQIITDLTVIILCGIFDRYRGDKKHLISRTFEKLLYAIAVGYLAGFRARFSYDLEQAWQLSFSIDRNYLIFIACFCVGVSFGWGAPMGGYLNNRKMYGAMEWWQFGYFRKNALAALWLRGILWAACIAPICIKTNNLSPIFATAIGFPLSCVIAKKLVARGFQPADYYDDASTWGSKTPWNLSELLRGWIVGAITRIFN